MKPDSNSIYRLLVPKPLRTGILLQRLRKLIPHYHSNIPESLLNDEIKEVVGFVKEHGVKIFPYTFTDNYNVNSVEVFLDNESGLKYVLQDGKRLYFKRKWNAQRIRKSFHDLTLEQDEKSPHRYLSHDFQLGPEDILVDFGAAEGNFSLSVIEKVKKIYLFEADTEWIEALEKTFEPWKDKVEIIPKYVSDKDDEKHCSGDLFFANRDVSFFKIDVDGGERALLKGLEKTINERNHLRIALCTYHKHEDEVEFTTFLKKAGYDVRPSSGFMIFYYDKKIRPPYIRKALIRAIKNVQ